MSIEGGRVRDPLWLVGVAMTPFGRCPDRDLLDLASDAAIDALDDAGFAMADVGVLAAGTVFHANESVGQQLLKQIGQTGIPVYNVANACATGATALRTACLAVWAGDTDVALAVGVEQMGKLGLLATEVPRDGPTGLYRPEWRSGAVVSTEGILGDPGLWSIRTWRSASARRTFMAAGRSCPRSSAQIRSLAMSPECKGRQRVDGP